LIITEVIRFNNCMLRSDFDCYWCRNRAFDCAVPVITISSPGKTIQSRTFPINDLSRELTDRANRKANLEIIMQKDDGMIGSTF